MSNHFHAMVEVKPVEEILSMMILKDKIELDSTHLQGFTGLEEINTTKLTLPLFNNDQSFRP